MSLDYGGVGRWYRGAGRNSPLSGT